MESKKIAHLLYTPFTGLGLYGGHRGKRWLRNRIKIFKQFVVPSLLAQTSQDYTLWVSWRHEDRKDKDILALQAFLNEKGVKNVFTYSGICFWDDKYPDEEARSRLIDAIHGSMGELFDVIGDCDEVLMTIQPSDDGYRNDMVRHTQNFFQQTKDVDVYGFKKGYVMDYKTQKLCEWNPETTPPFYTIRFPREKFVDPLQHLEYTGPYKSHEYVKDYLNAEYGEDRGFIVGTHSDNISTVFDHPYAGHEYLGSNISEILDDFGLGNVKKLHVPFSVRGWVFHNLPYGVKRKLRYWSGEKKWVLRPLFSFIYKFIRA